ncbi:ADL174Cp [Eremothecium gossypii ATCC 10895]|uniref:ADL174Cp n=1 Tax=Eremothecium gossypii (strain ATCC 10895 / CBS 109.51 / FGSC 9923 / NRRL Y-1056) TaxID=284811 RepID=Q75AU4_EREGS|nr:ADL174Cp [Eremothecium gossypii ATCC 10895]AAS51746.2 ADL174Cp [Eremothecium gossypii ATCC 10895]AEY96043.1 FADL174Cp [Eremothecium gossypii FDAG1]
MRRLQLFKGNRATRCQEDGSCSRTAARRSAQTVGLLDLPPAALERIAQFLDKQGVRALGMASKALYEGVCHKLLYRNVTIESKKQLLKFNATLASSLRALCVGDSITRGQWHADTVLCIEFVNPESNDSLPSSYGSFNQGTAHTLYGSSVFSGFQRKCYAQRPSRINLDGLSNKHILSMFGHNDPDAHFDCLESEYVQYTYLELMVAALDRLSKLQRVILSDIAPSFVVPIRFSVLNDGSAAFAKLVENPKRSMTREDLRDFKLSSTWLKEYKKKYRNLPSYRTVELRAARCKAPVNLRPSLLCCFGTFQELILSNFALSNESFDTPFEYLPMQLIEGSKGVWDLSSPASSLVLDACYVLPGSGIMSGLHSYFAQVSHLALFGIRSLCDILLCRCLPALCELSIDCASKCFLSHEPVESDYYTGAAFEFNAQDNESTVETLVERIAPLTLLAPPPTTAVVILLNHGILNRSMHSYPRKAGTITTEQEKYFTSFGISKFYYSFHYFKSLWDRISNENINLKLINVSFTNVCPLEPQEFWQRFRNYQNDDQATISGIISIHSPAFASITRNTWDSDFIEHYLSYFNANEEIDITSSPASYQDNGDTAIVDPSMLNNYHDLKMFKDIPDANFWFFLNIVSGFKSVDFHVCDVNVLFGSFDWERMLGPILLGRKPLKIKDCRGNIRFSYDPCG